MVLVLSRYGTFCYRRNSEVNFYEIQAVERFCISDLVSSLSVIRKLLRRMILTPKGQLVTIYISIVLIFYGGIQCFFVAASKFKLCQKAFKEIFHITYNFHRVFVNAISFFKVLLRNLIDVRNN